MRLTHPRSIAAALACTVLCGILGAAEAQKLEYRLLATSKTSTMEKELNEAAAAGYVFSAVMGGQTGFGGKEVLVVMTKSPGAAARSYKLLATSRTSTMQKELQQAGDAGFDYCGQTVFESAFGGKEVSVILERNSAASKRVEFKLLATSRTSTMEKELNEAGAQGFEFLDMMVGSTAVGGKELLSLLRRYSD